jgi:competence protein ComEA
MLKKLFSVMVLTLALVWAASAAAAVDVNKASAAELDSIKGIGPSLSGKILDERKKATFKDWPDLISRVKGMGDKKASKLSREGLTVNGTSLKGDAMPAKPMATPAGAGAGSAASAPAAVKK